MAYELIKVSELPELTTPADANVVPIQDGDYLKRISFANLKEAASGDVADDLAAEYSASATYAIGDYCVKDGQLYRCTTAITTAEAWTSGHWTAVSLGADVSDLKSALDEQENLLYINVTDNLPTPENGWIRYSNGEKVGSSATLLYILPSDNIKKIHAFLTSDTNALCAIAFYSTPTVSTEGYIQSASVDFAAGTHNDGLWYDATVPDNCKCIAITTKIPSSNVSDYIINFDVGYIENDVNGLSTKIDVNTEAISSINTSLGTYATKDGTNYSNFIGRLKPCYDHLFANRTGEYVTIPHESVYHIRISAKLGFNCIEANIAETSDGVFIVNHLNNGKFGGYFHHVDGVTDISNIAVSSVTWAWIVENVRYNSTIPKYRTRPCTLEEFLGECKQQNIIPFATATNPNMITAIENIVGKNNYIAYGATRENAPNAIIYHWVSNLTTKQAILNYCNNIGKPFIFGLGNPSAFTDEKLADIIHELHQNGFMIGISYDDTKWYKYSALGFDFNGTQYLTNRLENGNICNFDTIFNYNDFTISNGTETDGVLSFSTDGTIRPNIADTVLSLGLIDIEINFSGKIQVQTRTLFGNYTITSNDKMLYYLSAPLINGHPKITIVCYEGATIYDIKFKASKC